MHRPALSLSLALVVGGSLTACLNPNIGATGTETDGSSSSSSSSGDTGEPTAGWRSARS